MRAYVWHDDPLLDAMVRVATADPDTPGLILSGSRGAGVAADDSDYDLIWVLSDAAYVRHAEQGEPATSPSLADERGALVELVSACPRRLAELAANPSWRTAGYADATVLLDRTGEVAALLQAIALRPEAAARAAVAGAFDSYLNASSRSLKAGRRRDELGGWRHAAESVTALVATLFALERRWPPYHDRLMLHLEMLGNQAWPPGYLAATFLAVLRTGESATQRDLHVRVAALLRAHGFGGVIDAWDGEIERITAQR